MKFHVISTQTYRFSVRSKNIKAVLTALKIFKANGPEVKKGKVHTCTGTEALYRPHGP
jgi:hypothetical protein